MSIGLVAATSVEKGPETARTSRVPREQCDRGLHQAVFEAMMESFVPGDRVLDVPAGEGAFANRLLPHGADLTCGDILPGNFLIDGVPCVRVDMNEPLPFEDRSFDWVVSIEGIEHLERPYAYLREASRVLRRGGRLVITTPNWQHLFSRLRFLATGFYYCAHRPINECSRDLLVDHISLLTYPLLRYGLVTAGFKVTAVETNRYHPISSLMRPVAPVIRAITRRVFDEERDPRQRRANEEILATMTSRAVLCGNILVIVAEKTA